MSWQIAETEIVGGQTRAFFWCNTSGCAFGPMMVDREAAEEVARRAGGDPRAVSLDALDHLYAGLIDEREYDPDPAPQPGEGGGETSQGFYAESIPVTFRDCHGDEHDVEAVGQLTRDGVTYWIVRVPPEEHGVLVATDVDGREWWDGYMLIVGDHMLTTESVRRLRTDRPSSTEGLERAIDLLEHVDGAIGDAGQATYWLREAYGILRRLQAPDRRGGGGG